MDDTDSFQPQEWLNQRPEIHTLERRGFGQGAFPAYGTDYKTPALTLFPLTEHYLIKISRNVRQRAPGI